MDRMALYSGHLMTFTLVRNVKRCAVVEVTAFMEHATVTQGIQVRIILMLKLVYTATMSVEC